MKRFLYLLLFGFIPSLASAQVTHWGDIEDDGAKVLAVAYNTLGTTGAAVTITGISDGATDAVTVYNLNTFAAITNADTFEVNATGTGDNIVLISTVTGAFADGEYGVKITDADAAADGISLTGRWVGFFSVGRYASADEVLEGATVTLTTAAMDAISADILASTNGAATVAAQLQFLTGNAFTRLGAPAGASISADIAAIENQTDDIGTAGAGLTAVSASAAILSSVVMSSPTPTNTSFSIASNLGTTNLVGTVISLTNVNGTYFGRVDTNPSPSAITVTWYNATPTVTPAGGDVVKFYPPIGLPTNVINANAIADDAIDASATTATAFGVEQTGDTYALANGTNGFVAIEAQTDDIGTAGAGLTSIDLPNQTMNITGTITGNLSGNVTGSVGSVAGNVTGSVGSIGTDGITAASIANNAIVNGTEATGFGSAQTGDAYAIVSNGTHGNAAIKGYVDDIGAAGAGLTAIDLPDQIMSITGNITGNLSGSVNSVTGAVGSVGTDGITAASIQAGAIANGTEATGFGVAQTGDAFARLGAPANASVSADIAAIENQTDDIGVAGAGLTAVEAVATLSPEDITAIADETALAVGDEVAVGVWDYAAASADNPGTMGLLLTTNINATIASRALETGGNLTAVAAKTTFLPSATSGQAGGLLINGTNTGNISIDGTLAISGAVTLPSLSMTGALTVNSLSIAGTNTVAQTGDSYAIVNSSTHGNAAIKGFVDDIGTAGAGLTAAPWNASWDTEVESEVDDALRALSLQYLFASAYNPASKPGTATGLLNVLVENDGGVPRYTVNALEQAPSGTGASPSVIADAVWDEVKTGHNVGDSFGVYLDAQVSTISGGTATLDPQQVRDAMLMSPTPEELPAEPGSIDAQLAAIPTTTTLDPQAVRNAMSLASTAPSMAAGSIDALLNDIPATAAFPANFDVLAIAPTTGQVTADAEVVLSEDDLGEITDAVISASGVAQVHNQAPVSAFTSKLGTRRDGVVVASPTQRIVPGEIAHIWIDCSSVVGGNIANASNEASTNANVVVSAIGVYGKVVSMYVDATAAADGEQATITCNVNPVGTQVIKVSLAIEVDDD